MRIVIISILLSLSYISNAQQWHLIKNIDIEGNKITKSNIIEREITVLKGYFYTKKELEKQILASHKLLNNTNLFNDIKINYQTSDSADIKLTNIKVVLIEKWYIWPIPTFEIADRNYRQWSEFGFPLNRTNYGLYLFCYNVFGKNQTLKLTAINGYTQNFGILYKIPGFKKNANVGIEIQSSFKKNKEIWYGSENNKLQFYKSNDKVLLRRFENKISLLTRNSYFTSDQIDIEYNKINIADTIFSSAMNPNYLVHQNMQKELVLRHQYIIEKRDNKFYPLDGFYLKNEISLNKLFNDTFVNQNIKDVIEINYYKKSKLKTMYWSLGLKMKWNSKQILPYTNFKGLGYKTDVVRGYEPYVIDGSFWSILRTNVKKNTFNTVLKSNKNIHAGYKSWPIKSYLNLFSDMGYVYNSNTNLVNNLSNKFLIGGGLGFDILIFNDKIIRMEVATNHLLDLNFNLYFEKAF